jgi:hypothetical protein
MQWRGARRAAGTGCSAGKRRPAPTAGPGTGSSSRVRRGRTGSSCGVKAKRVEGGVSAGVAFPPLLHYTTTPHVPQERVVHDGRPRVVQQGRDVEHFVAHRRARRPRREPRFFGRHIQIFHRPLQRRVGAGRGGPGRVLKVEGAQFDGREFAVAQAVWVGVERSKDLVSFLWRG